MARLQLMALLSILVALSVQHLNTVGGAPTEQKQPNIIIVLADDYGFNDIGYHSTNKQIRTPTLDELAEEGVKLENYYVQPRCSPTRSQLISGRYQIHTGLQHAILWRWQKAALPIDSPTIANKIQDAGYSTHMIGKWHLGFYQEKFLPNKRGFDTYFGYLSCSEDYYNHTKNFYDGKEYLDLRDNNGPVWNESEHYTTHLFTQKAVNLIRNHNKKKPLFMYLAYEAVHSPLEVPKFYEDKYANITDKNRRIYAGMVDTLDEGVRNVTNAMKEAGLWDNTILVFSTDNGGQIKAGGNNWPLRGWKGSLWEGGIRGVGFVSGGALPAKGKVNRELIHVSDWFPTLVRVAGGTTNGTKPLDGYDQWDTIIKGAPSRRKVLLHNIDILYGRHGKNIYPHIWDVRIRSAIRVGDLKLITGQPDNGSWIPPPDGQRYDIPAVNDHRHKNVWLFNITADPYEKHDISHERHKDVKHMLRLIKKFDKTAVKPNYPPKDPRSNPALHGGAWGPWLPEDDSIRKLEQPIFSVVE